MFRVALLKAAKQLTGPNIRDLGFLCDKIPTARREQITSGTELFEELQGHGTLSEDNVTTLIGWMHSLELTEAVKPLEEYNQGHTTPTGAGGAGVLSQKCLVHHDQTLKYGCVSCDVPVCPECVLTSHKPSMGCDVVRIEQIPSETSKRRHDLSKEIESALSDVKDAAALWEERKMSVMARLKEEEASDLRDLFDELQQIQHLQTKLEKLERERAEWVESSLQELRKIDGKMRAVGEMKTMMAKRREASGEGSGGGLSVKVMGGKSGGDGTSTATPLSTLIGGVFWPRDVLIYDERRVDAGGVLLVCINQSDPGQDHWRHAIRVGDQTSPVVMSYDNLFYDKKHHMLFGVGRAVYIVHLTGPTHAQNVVGSVTPLEIGDVSGESWVTGISADSSRGSSGEFLISMHNEKTIREIRATGEPLRVIDPGDMIPSKGITGVAHCGNTLAIIGRECDDVVVCTAGTDGRAGEHCGTLRSPVTGLRPARVVRESDYWQVLFVGGAAGDREWNVVHFDEKGEMWKVCAEGRASNDREVPVNITRGYSTGYVVFADSSSRSFEIPTYVMNGNTGRCYFK